MALNLKIEGIAGTSIEDAAEDMLRLANLLKIMIEMDFNGKQILATRAMTKNMIIDSYYNQLIEDNR